MDDRIESITTECAPTPWGLLPPRLRVLFVYEQSNLGTWVIRSLQQERICQVDVTESANPLVALERLREESFDTVVVTHEGVQSLDWIEALRVGSTPLQPILVLGSVADREFSALCFESGADGFLTVDSMTIRELVWHLARAAERRRLMEENDRLRNDQKRFRTIDHDDTIRAIKEQRDLLHVDPNQSMPSWLTTRAHELLTTYVVMGTGQLSQEVDRLVELVMEAQIAPQTVIAAFHSAIESMVSELGARSARHILNRGNALMLETLLKLPHRGASTSFATESSHRTD